MKIQVLGGHGGLAQGCSTTSFLIDGKLLIDAGAVASKLSVLEQSRIDHILISHCHLDHIKDLAFICDNCFGVRSKPFEVYSHETVNIIIKKHLLNDVIWPDFTKLPTEKNPTMRMNDLIPEKKINIGDYEVTPVRVQHPFDAMGYIVEKGDSAVLFTLDTGPTERMWEMAREIKNLKAIFTEISFPNRFQNVADVSDHHTTQTLKAEMAKMPQDIPLILTHLKPNFRHEILKEVQSLDEKRIHVLEKDGEVFNY